MIDDNTKLRTAMGLMQSELQPAFENLLTPEMKKRGAMIAACCDAHRGLAERMQSLMDEHSCADNPLCIDETKRTQLNADMIALFGGE